MEIWKKPDVVQAARMAWATDLRAEREGVKEGWRSIKGIVGRVEG